MDWLVQGEAQIQKAWTETFLFNCSKNPRLHIPVQRSRVGPSQLDYPARFLLPGRLSGLPPITDSPAASRICDNVVVTANVKGVFPKPRCSRSTVSSERDGQKQRLMDWPFLSYLLQETTSPLDLLRIPSSFGTLHFWADSTWDARDSLLWRSSRQHIRSGPTVSKSMCPPASGTL
jgi:hypothetical protein